MFLEKIHNFYAKRTIFPYDFSYSAKKAGTKADFSFENFCF